MTLRLNGSTSGYVEIDAPAAAGSNTLVLPNGNGTNGQYLQTAGNGVLSWATPTDTGTGWTMDATGTSLSGESTVSFTGIPTTATKVILVWEDLSTSASAEWRIRLGHDATFGGFSYHVASGHTGPSNANGAQQMTGSFQTYGLADASATLHGVFELDAGTGNYWYGRAHINHEGNAYIYWMSGYGDGGSNVLDRVALATTSGTFDGGTAYCHYLEA